jgi:glycosyltransferase involved in cell wall biosynthesis
LTPIAATHAGSMAPHGGCSSGVSVVMPAYGQAAVLPRAVRSLLRQDLSAWELIVVDDGSPDDTAAALRAFPADPRIRLIRRPHNGGLGRALNAGLDAARAPLVAYLPCDDVLHPTHLRTLASALDGDAGAIAAVASLDGSGDAIIQLVQVAHRRTADRWTERDALESDDLNLLMAQHVPPALPRPRAAAVPVDRDGARGRVRPLPRRS